MHGLWELKPICNFVSIGSQGLFPFLAAYNILKDFFLSFLFLSAVFDHVFVVLMCIWFLTVSYFILKVYNLLTIDNNSSVLSILWRERRWSFWVPQLYHKTDHLTNKKQLYFLWNFWILEFQLQYRIRLAYKI